MIKKPIPDAVATKFGWAHPETGELLVSIKNLPNPIDDYKPNRRIIKIEKTDIKISSKKLKDNFVVEVLEADKPEIVELTISDKSGVESIDPLSLDLEEYNDPNEKIVDVDKILRSEEKKKRIGLTRKKK